MESLLAYSGSDDDSGVGGDQIYTNQSTTDNSDDDSSQQGVPESTSAINEKPQTTKGKLGLLSAVDLFAVQADTVYIKPSNKEFEITPSDPDTKSVPGIDSRMETAAIIKHPAVIEKKADYLHNSSKNDSAEDLNSKKHRTIDKYDHRVTAIRDKKTVGKKRGETDELSTKDKIKRQRLSGQSGIGNDFKEWRSEEEMRQRQMFD